MKATIHGALLGLWWTSWIAFYAISIEFGAFMPKGIPDSATPPSEATLSWLWESIQITLPTDTLVLVILGTTVGAFVGVLMDVLARSLKLDPTKVVIPSLRWSVRTLGAYGRVFLIGGLVAIALILLGEAGGAIVVIVMLIALFLVPFAVLRPQVVSGSGPVAGIRPRWPGALPFLILLLGFSVWATADFMGFGAQSLPLFVVASIAMIIVDGVVTGVTSSAFLEKVDRKHFVAWIRHVLRKDVLGAWVMMEVWLLSVLLWVIPPVAVAFLWRWKQIPFIATWLKSEGMEFSTAAKAFIYSGNLFESVGLVMLALPFLMFRYIAFGHSWVLLRDALEVKGEVQH